ncbi:MAG: SPOR domain-containing protein [Pseudomonadota bacterium]
MAQMHYTHDVGYVGMADDAPAHEQRRNQLKQLTNFAGAVASLALIAGVAVWSYNLIVRDVSGIPVVQAASGEMRVRPADPGGQLAQNTGLAVNEVAAGATTSEPTERLLLAPAPLDLAQEDAPADATGVAPVQQPEPLDVAASLETVNGGQAAEIDALVSRLIEGAEPIEVVTEAAVAPVVTTVAAPDPTADAEAEPVTAVVTGPGPKTSLRPTLRPRSAPATVVPASAPATAEVRDIDPATLPIGTRLVQLGAFDSADIARQQWDAMRTRFDDYLTGKDRVIQQAQSGGRTFYRLRAHGFTDLSDARRFCSALVAEGADCIPVVTR